MNPFMNAPNMPIRGRRRASLFLPVAFLLAIVVVVAASCRGQRTDGRGGILTVAGSTSVQPFAEKLAEEYMALHPERNINVQGGGSTAGIRAAESGAAQIGMSSRQLKPDEARELHSTVIAHDGIALIVNRANPVQGITREEAARIFAGRITRWEQVGGAPGEIDFVTREEGSGTRSSFEEKVMGNLDISPRALVQDSNGAVREIVAEDSRAIGYISLGLVDERVKALAVDGIFPSGSSILEGKYTISRPFIFVSRGAPAGPLSAFIDFVLAPQGQALLAKEGLMPVKE